MAEHIEAHRARLAALFDTPNLNHVPQRLYRAAYRVAGEYVVASIVQRFTQEGSEIVVYVTRAFQTVKLALSGKYSVHEVCAFLALDTVDPAEVDWSDETTYIVVPSTVDAIMEKFR